MRMMVATVAMYLVAFQEAAGINTAQTICVTAFAIACVLGSRSDDAL